MEEGKSVATWVYYEPTDETANYTRRVVYTEAQIVEEHADYYRERYPTATDKDVINEWIVIHWAAPTNLPPGETTWLQARKPSF